MLYHALHVHSGIELNIASPAGGHCPIDPSSLKSSEHEEEVQAFLADECAMKWIKCTDRLGKFDLGRFQAVIFVGGPGTMRDFGEREVSETVKKIWNQGGVVAAIGHGAAALVAVRDERGESWLKGKKVTSNTTEEDQDMRLEKILPFSIEKKLKEVGANFKKANKFATNVIEDGRLITAQNRNSTREWIRAIETKLQK